MRRICSSIEIELEVHLVEPLAEPFHLLRETFRVPLEVEVHLAELVQLLHLLVEPLGIEVEIEVEVEGHRPEVEMLRLADLGGDGLPDAVADHLQIDALARLGTQHLAGQIPGRLDRRAVELDDHVTLEQPRAFGGRPLDHALDTHALVGAAQSHSEEGTPVVPVELVGLLVPVAVFVDDDDRDTVLPFDTRLVRRRRGDSGEEDRQGKAEQNQRVASESAHRALPPAGPVPVLHPLLRPGRKKDVGRRPPATPRRVCRPPWR
jgi:hypothetical protein